LRGVVISASGRFPASASPPRLVVEPPAPADSVAGGGALAVTVDAGTPARPVAAGLRSASRAEFPASDRAVVAGRVARSRVYETNRERVFPLCFQ